MFKKLIDKLFCLHQWKTHTKEVYEWTESEIDVNSTYMLNPLINTFEYKETVEVLICEKCGKIKKVVY